MPKTGDSSLGWAILPGLAVFALSACTSDYARGAPSPATGKGKTTSRWTVGIYSGSSPLSLSAPPGVSNPVLTSSDVTDMDADIVAHPFLAIEGSRYFLFFTVKNRAAKKAGIGMAQSSDGLRWSYRRVVVAEPYELAYPFILKWRDEYYMIPEAHTESRIPLFRATRFPDEWIFEKNLLTGEGFIAASVVSYQNLLWMFVVRPGNETLRLFFASDLKGPWTEHPGSPIVPKDAHIARPAGRPVVVDGVLYRLAGDCAPTYGLQVRAFRVTQITTTAYREEMVEIPLVRATSQGWNAEAMHHVDAHRIGDNRWIAAVDALGR